jgi:hypothetical protein
MPRGIAPRRVLRLFLGVENGDVLIWPLRFFPRPSGTLGREGGQGRPPRWGGFYEAGKRFNQFREILYVDE